MEAADHPIIALLISLLSAQAGSFTLEPRSQQQLSAALRSYFGKPGLPEAVRVLIGFAFFLQHRKSSHQAARAIIEVLKSAEAAFGASQLSVSDQLAALDREENARRLINRPKGSLEAIDPSAPVTRWWETMKK